MGRVTSLEYTSKIQENSNPIDPWSNLFIKLVYSSAYSTINSL